MRVWNSDAKGRGEDRDESTRDSGRYVGSQQRVRTLATDRWLNHRHISQCKIVGLWMI